MTPFEVLYCRWHRSLIGCFEVGDMSLTRSDLGLDAMKKVKVIREKLKAFQSHQKAYADVRKRDLEFREGDRMYLKVSPVKGVMHFGKKGKLGHKYMEPYEIMKRIGKVAYELDLSMELAMVHQVFHVSMLRKFMGHSNSIILLKDMSIEEDFSYKEVLVQILD